MRQGWQISVAPEMGKKILAGTTITHRGHPAQEHRPGVPGGTRQPLRNRFTIEIPERVRAGREFQVDVGIDQTRHQVDAAKIGLRLRDPG